MVSVIVPVYNCGEFLSKCVESVLAQTYTDLELILVDDGSFDGSSELCDLWAQSDGRIKVIHQKNAGVSAARNAGMDAAKGEWFGFVDADDYVAPKYLQTLLAAAQDCDMVMYDLITVWEGVGSMKDTMEQLPESCVLERKDWSPELLLEMAGSACRCLYSRALVGDIRFPVGVKFSEDRVFNLYAMGKAKRLHYLKTGLYFRLMQPGSACHRYHEDYFDACLLAREATQKALAETWQEERYSVAYESQFISGAIAATQNYWYKTSPLSWGQRLEKVRSLCANEALQQALDRTSYGGIRAKLIKHKQAVLLCACAWLANKKHGR